LFTKVLQEELIPQIGFRIWTSKWWSTSSTRTNETIQGLHL